MSKKIKVYMGILSTGQREDIHTYLFRDLERRYGDKIEMVFPDQCTHRFMHDFARNEVVEEFLESDCDVLWFLDSDVSPPSFIFDLITNHWDKWQAAGAPYPLFMNTPGTGEMSILFTAYKGVLNAEGQRGIYMSSVPQSGTEFIDALATGCLFLKRELFSKISKPYFEFKFDPKTRRIVEGEDLGFALKLHDAGIKFFCDYGMVCKHYKRICLLDMNNYAITMSNHKVMDYDKEIRDQVSHALTLVRKQAYEQGLKEGKESAYVPKQAKSGLILPNSLAR